MPGKLPRSGEPRAGALGNDATELNEACLDRSEPMTGEPLPSFGMPKGERTISPVPSSCPLIEEGVTEMAGESPGVMRLGGADPSEDPAGPDKLLLSEGAANVLLPVLTLRPMLAANFWQSAKCSSQSSLASRESVCTVRISFLRMVIDMTLPWPPISDTRRCFPARGG